MLVAKYKYKKDLKGSIGKSLLYEETSMFGSEYSSDGKFTVVGPAAYIRNWYAAVTMKNDKIVKVV